MSHSEHEVCAFPLRTRISLNIRSSFSSSTQESQHPESSDFAEQPHSKVTYGLWHGKYGFPRFVYCSFRPNIAVVNLKPIAMNNQSRPKSPSFASLYVFLWHFMPLLPALLMTRICWTIGTLNLGRRLGGVRGYWL